MSTNMQLTEEQLARIAENRQRAMEKRAQRQAAAELQQHLNGFGHQSDSKRPSYSGSSTSFSNYDQTHQNPRQFTLLKNGRNNAGPSSSSNGGDKTEIEEVTIECVLTEPNRFSAISSYNPTVVSMFKQFSTKSYTSVETMKACSEPSVRIRLKELPVWVKTIMKAEISGCARHTSYDLEVADYDIIDEPLRQTLIPYQEIGIKRGIKMNGRIFLCDEMGLGKTIQALGIMSYFRSKKHAGPALIVCPSNAKGVWEQEMGRWLISVDEDDLVLIKSARTKLKRGLRRADIVISSYDLLDCLTQHKFETVILDESHSVKDGKAQRTVNAKKVCQGAEHVILISGTPALSRPKELYTQLNILAPKIFKNYHDYIFRYCEAKEKEIRIRGGGVKKIIEDNGAGNLEELQTLMNHSFMIRRLKSNVLTLTNKKRHSVQLNMASIKIKMDELKNNSGNNPFQNLPAFASSSSTAAQNDDVEMRGGGSAEILEYFHQTSIAKAEAVVKYVIDELLEHPDEKLLVFTYHLPLSDKLAVKLATSMGFTPKNFITITGATKSEDRTRLVRRFQEDDEVKVAILSIMAANAGITLTASRKVIFAELYWNPGILLQCEDRTHRVGQTKEVDITYLVAPGTADDHLWPMINRKLDTLDKVGLSGGNFSDAETRAVSDSAVMQKLAGSESAHETNGPSGSGQQPIVMTAAERMGNQSIMKFIKRPITTPDNPNGDIDLSDDFENDQEFLECAAKLAKKSQD